ncbi:MAG: PIN domain-containing protein [Syntrophobacteraceae bacterium]|nr:PIN domain-containing protein [Syntrophobacteraceae bacterium]
MNGMDLIVDTNLLVLFVVGTTDRNLIARHKRLKAFSDDDFDLLCEIIACSRQVFVTPNTVSETSNLLGHIDEPARTRIFETFRVLLLTTPEEYVESGIACNAREFLRLGITDSALLHIADESRTILTTDLDLYLSALSRGLVAHNFNHLRELRL